MVEKRERRSPEFHVLIEYEARCECCGFEICDDLQDANEKDGMANVRAICEGWHFTTNRVANHNCDGTLTIMTKTTYWV